MKILGIDPGSTLMGYGVIETSGSSVRALSYGVLKIKAKALPDKLLELSTGLKKLLTKHTPDSTGLEKLFFAKNKKTAIEVAQARGVILLGLLQANLPVTELTPAEIKVAVTSYGAADKLMVKKMVGKILNIETLAADDNAWDALAVALAVSSHQKWG